MTIENKITEKSDKFRELKGVVKIEGGYLVWLEHVGDEQDYVDGITYEKLLRIAQKFGGKKGFVGKVVQVFDDSREYKLMVFYFPEKISGKLSRFSLNTRVGRFLDKVVEAEYPVYPYVRD